MGKLLQVVQILGARRIIVLAGLVAINALLAAATYLYYIPHNVTLTTQLNQLAGQVSTKRNNTDSLRTDYQAIEEQKVFYGNLKAAGFFGDQNRTLIRERVSDIQKFTNVLAAHYNVTAAKLEHNQLADDAGYVVLDSPVNIAVDALDDADFYNFVYCLENAFPGHVSVNSVTVTRMQDLTEPILKQIGGGDPVAVVKGTVTFSWRTMVPSAQIAAPANTPKG